MAGRGRPYTYEEIVRDLRDDGKLEWHKIFAILAKTTISGQRIWGRCYMKIIAEPVDDGKSFGAYELERVYATHKEVFQDKLRNSDES